MFRYILYLSMFILLLVPISQAQVEVHEWTSLDGPYWSRGIDVAFGAGDQYNDWYRYLIGADKSDTQIFYWMEGNQKWTGSDIIAGAVKIVSYDDGNGRYAFFARENYHIYVTSDGGENWGYISAASTIPNKQFSALEIYEPGPGQNIYVGCQSMVSQASVYIVYQLGETWVWDEVADGLIGLNVNALRYTLPRLSHLVAATSDGIYTHWYQAHTWDQASLDDEVVVAMDDLDYSDQSIAVAGIWAETGGTVNERKLYYGDCAELPPMSDPVEVEVGNPPSSFNKEVNDIVAFYKILTLPDSSESDPFQSVYLAAQDGLYLLDVEELLQTNVSVREYIDFTTLEGSPFRYDYPVLSLDCLSDPGETESEVLVGTLHNVYLITEERDDEDLSITSLTIEDITNGTFISYTVAAGFPENVSSDKIVFTVSDVGIIKKYDKEAGESSESWEFSGLAFVSGDEGYEGTDITTDFGGATFDYLIASSKDGNDGIIMISDDGGDSWEDSNPGSDPEINSVDLDPVSFSNSGYAAGYASTVWLSTNNGESWTTSGSFGSPEFHDILSDPDAGRDDYVYVAGNDGSGDAKVSIYNGTAWTTIETGLSSVDDVIQLAKNAAADQIYAATDIGIYKADPTAGTVTWSARTNGTGAVKIGSIINDSNNLFNFLASTPPDAATPKIWASCDSARSWIEYYNGDIDTDDPAISKLAASQDANTGFIACTDSGAYYLGNIFRAGTISSNETWGSGKVIVNGDIEVESGCTLTVDAPCTVLVAYDFDIDGSGKVGSSTEIIIDGVLLAEGTSTDSIVFMSSKPSGAAAGDWWGIKIEGGAEASFAYCTIKHSDYGIVMYDTSQVTASHCTFEEMTYTGINNSKGELSADHCVFKNLSQRGIYSYRAESVVDYCDFESCEDYGIYTIYDVTLNLDSTIITNCTITADTDTILEDSYYGIRAYNIDKIRIEDNTIRTYEQGGIELYNSDAIVKDNYLIYTGNYGIYAQSFSDATITHNAFDSLDTGIYTNSYSDPTIRSCLFDSVDTGVLYYYTSTPNIGENTFGNFGNNNFEECEDYFIRQSGIGGMSIVKAERNWFGSGTPDPTKFSGTVDYDPWLTSEPAFKIIRNDESGLPYAFGLLGNYPNPFNPSTMISYSLAEPGYTSITIYNLLGQKIASPLSEFNEAGLHSVIWNGCNAAGMPVASGIYFYRLESGEHADSEKMMLLR
ncbi:MAG: T9SS type A sorting domain-containing protein [candidate division Zixibacteria bacterium]|nr:T9SS type A sorting domain-containing protein [candidate division Zixibacteria bacterium]